VTFSRIVRVTARRRFVSRLALALTGLSGWRNGAAAAAQAATAPSLETTLTAFLDTLLPADALSGSASDLGVHRTLLAESAGDALYARLIAAGCQFLDRAAEGSFAGSSARVREVIVEWMAQSDYDEVPRRFYEIVRQRGVELYYSQPQAWGGVPIRRPPQPIGYPDHWK
jgi:hypothetical protein